jgi:hypothetical protein
MDPEDANATAITDIRFKDSSIYSIPMKVFQRFRNVNVFVACEQEIHEIIPRTFLYANLMKYLFLDGNKLSYLHADAFMGAERLDAIFLRNNQLQYLHRDTFRSNSELTTISLRYNRLTALDEKMFSRWRQLRSVHLSGNLCINKNFNGRFSLATIEEELKYCGDGYRHQRISQHFQGGKIEL